MRRNKRDRGSLALWATDCAEHVLPCFEEHPKEVRPRNSAEAGRAWARDEIAMGAARGAAFAAHAATAHVADHAADYAVKAATEAAVPADSAAATAK